MEQDDRKQRGYLVGLNVKGDTSSDSSDDDTLQELKALLEAAGGECAGITLQNLDSVNPKTYIGSGKVEEIKELAKASEADMVIFDNELSPSQKRNLENILDMMVLDRSALVLDIFAQRARTAEGKLQVELAQLNYILPRLTGKGVELSRLGGGIGTRGPGESKLESDRRHIKRRIDKLKADLEEVSKNRAVQRVRRNKLGLPLVSLAGYTNAGKSTILNLLSGAEVSAKDRLFDTLDSTVRKVRVNDTLEVLLTDTVGFIRKLPHHLIKAFKSTLEEVVLADVILLVTDVSDEDWRIREMVCEQVLNELDATEKPIIRVYNKMDRAQQTEHIPGGSGVVHMSAKTGEGTDKLLEAIAQACENAQRKVKIVLPYSDSSPLDRLYKQAKVISVEYLEDGIHIEAVVNEMECGKIREYLK